MDLLEVYKSLETFMGGDQRTGEGSKPRIPCVVSKSDRDHGTATMYRIVTEGEVTTANSTRGR